MKQIFEPYEKWEDYKSGMYNSSGIIDKDKKVIESINLLSSPTDFYESCKKVMQEWKVSTDVNLSNKSINRRAWLGAAACMISNSCPEYLTRVAWSLLNEDVQQKANNIADKIIQEYERENSGLCSSMGEPMLF
jgi:hypothetical protein